MSPGAAAYSFSRRGRTPRLLGVLICVYGALLAAIIFYNAARWLMALLALPTLPALYDLYADPTAGLRLDDAAIRWHSGRRHGELALDEIDHMRLDTRWDLSVRATAVLRSGRRIRLPDESLPPHRALEAALMARGLRVERHHFTQL
ncbi:hypothetical protein [Antarcticimicrobium luteum]|uniref:PH domain-containing protein n=1 Tax=Antarcticimicrobium luteum TaxID=2547397 RepID=A0A4R5UV70_9RHOB|nr:hypothetical protein [Antarcticimicrobium luteum]TDK43092.1 hypothetical protein E1832_17680 [Antarcticimicrobium luteum]